MPAYVKKRTPFLLFTVFGLVAAGAGVGSSFYTKRFLQTEHADKNVKGIPLQFRASMAMDDMLSDNAKTFDWIKKKDYIVRVEALVNGKDYVQNDGLLKLSEDGAAFTAVGIGSGRIVYQKTSFEDVVVEAPFTIAFSSESTSAYLTGSGYSLEEDGLITESEFATVKNLQIQTDAPLDFSDFEMLPRLERIEIKSDKVLAAIDANRIASGAHIYVKENLYADYMASPTWAEVNKRIFITPSSPDKVSVLLYREGGSFEKAEENVKEYISLEVTRGSTYADLEREHPISYEGHTYRGWTYNDRGSDYRKDMVFDRDVKLHARFEAQKYTVHFHFRDGSTNTEKQEGGFLYNDGVALPKADGLAYAKDYIFCGWSADPNAREVAYGPLETAFHLFETDTFDYHLYGVWAHPEFNVRYLNGDEVIASSTFSYGSPVEISVPTKKIPGEGRFIGFSRSKNATAAEYQIGDVVPSFYVRDIEPKNIDLYAVFNPNESFGITYLDKDGAALYVDPDRHYDYNPIDLLSWGSYRDALTKEGYRFVGWKDVKSGLIYVDSRAEFDRLTAASVSNLVDADVSGNFRTDNFHDVSAVTLEPYFVKNTFQIRFDSSELGASDTMYNDGTAAYDEDFHLTGLTGRPSRYGYMFQYFTSPEYAGELNNQGEYLVSADINKIYKSLRDSYATDKEDNNFEPTFETLLTPAWFGIEHKVHFDLGGKAAEPITDQTIRFGDLVQKPADPSAAHWLFVGWFDENGTPWDFSKKVEGDITLKAHWVSDGNYVVVYDMGGVGVAPKDEHDYVPDEYVNGGVAPVPAHVPGYVFQGWFEDEARTTPFDFEHYRIDKTTTYVYAKWEALKYTINFHRNGHGATYPSQERGYGAAVANPGVMEEYGWTFVGWYRGESLDDSLIWDFKTDRISEDYFATPTDTVLDLYARWERTQFKVSFSSSVDSTYTKEYMVNQGEKLTEVPSVPAAIGYTQGRWLVVDANGNKSTFNPDDPINGPLNVVATYDLERYTISYVSPIGALPNNEIVVYGENVTDPQTQDLPSWHFVGWYKEKTFENKWDFTRDRPEASMTLYAKWECTITFVANDDNYPVSHNIKNVPSAVTVTYGDKVAKPADPSGTGLSFLYWGASANATSAFDFNAVVTGHTTLYAIWSKLSYTLTLDPNGGSLSGSSTQTRYYGQTGSISNPSRKDYDFTGWKIKGTDATFNNSSQMPDRDIALYANWQKHSTCVGADTLITMADRSTKMIRDVRPGDMVLAFDHYTGKECSVPVLYATASVDVTEYIMHLRFSDDTTLEIIDQHGLFDATTNRYITVNKYNYERLIGHEFFKDDGTHVTLLSVDAGIGTTDTGAIFTGKTMNHYFNGVLGTFVQIDELLNIFEMDENHVVIPEKMAEMLEIYGLMKLEDFGGYMAPEIYEVIDNVKYFSVVLGTGSLNEEGLFNLLKIFQEYDVEVPA